jgi:hypothetical protein
MRPGVRAVEVPQIQDMLAAGKSVAEIAANLNVSEECIASFAPKPKPAPAAEEPTEPPVTGSTSRRR